MATAAGRHPEAEGLRAGLPSRAGGGVLPARGRWRATAAAGAALWRRRRLSVVTGGSMSGCEEEAYSSAEDEDYVPSGEPPAGPGLVRGA